MEIGPDGKPRGFEIDSPRRSSRARASDTSSCKTTRRSHPRTRSGKFDAIMASINITEEAKDAHRLHRAVLPHARAVRAAEGSGIEITRDGLANRAVGVQGTTNLDDWLTKTWGDVAWIVRYPTQDALYLDMHAARLDVMFFELAAATIAFLRKPGGEAFEPAGAPLCGREVVGEGIAIGLPKGRNPDLLARLDRAIAAIHADRTYTRIQKRYFDFDLSCGGVG
jgi:arginine/ornithine transport system substrate-binding protein